MKKDKLEQFFSDKLENFEAPYSKEAWTSLESKLGNGAGATGLSTGAKIALFSAAAIVIAVVTFVALPNKEVTTQEPIAQTEQPMNIQSIENTELELNSSSETISAEQETNGSAHSTVHGTETIQQINAENGAAPSVQDHSSSTSSTEGRRATQEPNSTTPNTPPAVYSKNKYIVGSIGSTVVCRGEGVNITNPGKEGDLVRLMVNNNITELTKPMKTSIAFDETTEILFLNDKNEVIGTELIQVLDTPKPSFDSEANIYENGLPTAKFSSYGNFRNVLWDFGNGQFAEGQQVIAHYFDKGTYSVVMTVTDINGCIGSTTKHIEITDKYNLLATNSIRLNDPNLETRTFMPYCLKERNVKFTLTIIDPKDNTIVFTSKDVSNVWDGTDQRTGRILPSFKTYIWQVQLEETLPGERGIYNGTVTIVE
jgi:hypothetical protein